MVDFLAIIGTRPEAIKLAPVILQLRRRGKCVRICTTGQHREMLLPHLRTFALRPDYSLRTMRRNQGLDLLTSRLLQDIPPVIRQAQPKSIIVQGDSTSALAGAMAAFHSGIPVAHVEAGLRTFDLESPFPEEFNRRTISMVAQFHFAPTESARQNLLREGTDPGSVFVTGNTVVDSLKWALKQSKSTIRDRKMWY